MNVVAVSRGFFDAMREHPLVLAVVVTNFALLGFLFWTSAGSMDQVYKANAESQQLLAKCVTLEGDMLKVLMSKGDSK